MIRTEDSGEQGTFVTSFMPAGSSTLQVSYGGRSEPNGESLVTPAIFAESVSVIIREIVFEHPRKKRDDG